MMIIIIIILKLLRKKPAVSLAKFIIYKIVDVIIHFVVIIASYLALIRLLFVELGSHQIKKKYIQYNTIQIYIDIHRFRMTAFLSFLSIEKTKYIIKHSSPFQSHVVMVLISSENM